MDDERIEHALKLGPVDEPAYRPVLPARIRASDHVAPEAPTRGSADDGPALAAPARIDVRRRTHTRASRAPRLATFAQLAAVIIVAVVTVAIVLPGVVGRARPSGDMLERLAASGAVRILVPQGPPQTLVTGGVRIGFDIDVADALAEQLLLKPDISAVGADPGRPASAWDLSAGLQDLGTSRRSKPYAWWPAWLATRAGSVIASIDDLSGHPVCVVVASAADTWLQGVSGTGGRDGTEIVRAANDDECIAALADGRVDALVTNTLFDDELASRGLVAVGTEPVAQEPRVVRLAATGEDTDRLVRAIDDAIDRLRASGRLGELSRQSFGGRDLTEVTP